MIHVWRQDKRETQLNASWMGFRKGEWQVLDLGHKHTAPEYIHINNSTRISAQCHGKLFSPKRWRKPASSNLGLEASVQDLMALLSDQPPLPHLQQRVGLNQSPAPVYGGQITHGDVQSCCLCTPQRDATSASLACVTNRSVFPTLNPERVGP